MVTMYENCDAGCQHTGTFDFFVASVCHLCAHKSEASTLACGDPIFCVGHLHRSSDLSVDPIISLSYG